MVGAVYVKFKSGKTLTLPYTNNTLAHASSAMFLLLAVIAFFAHAERLIVLSVFLGALFLVLDFEEGVEW